MDLYDKPGNQHTPEGEIRQIGAFAHGLRSRARRSRRFRIGLQIVAVLFVVMLFLSVLTAP